VAHSRYPVFFFFFFFSSFFFFFFFFTSPPFCRQLAGFYFPSVPFFLFFFNLALPRSSTQGRGKCNTLSLCLLPFYPQLVSNARPSAIVSPGLITSYYLLLPSPVTSQRFVDLPRSPFTTHYRALDRRDFPPSAADPSRPTSPLTFDIRCFLSRVIRRTTTLFELTSTPENTIAPHSIPLLVLFVTYTLLG